MLFVGLNNAISKRDVKTLERAIFATKQNNYQEELEDDLKKSEALLKDLKKIEVATKYQCFSLRLKSIDLNLYSTITCNSFSRCVCVCVCASVYLCVLLPPKLLDVQTSNVPS